MQRLQISRCALLKDKAEPPPPKKPRVAPPANVGEDQTKPKPPQDPKPNAGGRPNGIPQVEAARMKLLESLKGDAGDDNQQEE